MKYQLASHTLAGGRSSNQDRIAVVERDNAVLMVLADGLGGHEGGALAAEILVNTVQHAMHAVRQPVITKPSAFLALAVMQAHKLIVARGAGMTPPISPRTTCVACLVQNGYAYWAHVGDSRLYHLRAGNVLVRTLDHTLTEEMHRGGLLSEEEMKRHPEKARLLKAVGGPNNPSISLGEETLLHTGDSLLLCTDGVWEALPNDSLGRFLGLASLEEGVEEMLLAAEARMKKKADNLTAIAFRWEDEVSKHLPIQSQAARETDHKTLIEDVQIRNAEKKVQSSTKKKPASTDGKKSLDDTIDELEAFLSKFEKH